VTCVGRGNPKQGNVQNLKEIGSMKKTRFPEDFRVTMKMVEEAQAQALADPRKEYPAFRDYHLAHGTLMLDWEAAFRTWLRRAVEYDKLKAMKPSTVQLDLSYRPTKESKPVADPRVREMLTGLINRFDVRKR
jgi:hypothetical protein